VFEFRNWQKWHFKPVVWRCKNVYITDETRLIFVWRFNFDLRTFRFQSWCLEGNCLWITQSPKSVSRYGHQKSLLLRTLQSMTNCSESHLYSFAVLTVLTITIIFRPYWHWLPYSSFTNAYISGEIQRRSLVPKGLEIYNSAVLKKSLCKRNKEI